MRIVLDTNVLFSGVYHSGPQASILRDILKRKYKIVLSASVVEEYIEVLQRPLKAQKQSIDTVKIINIMVSNGLMIDTDNIPTPSCSDPDDIKFLQTAIAGKAKFLISGDKHLLRVGTYKNGTVIKPKNFYDLFSSEIP